jgi:hypothetical protein
MINYEDIYHNIFSTHPELSFNLTVSYAEIYNEKVYDLQSEERVNLPVRNRNNNFFVDKLKITPCFSYLDIMFILVFFFF